VYKHHFFDMPTICLKILHLQTIKRSMKQFIKYCMLTLCAAFIVEGAQAQDIFSYGGRGVSAKEFMRMYTKNTFNNKKPDLSEAALREYITLYSRFKMKVTEAEAQGIDTLPNIKSELGQYKKQLGKSYLTDKDMLSKLTLEAYERMKKDVQASHILISMPKAAERDSARYFAKADSVYQLVMAKKIPWDTLVKAFSDDKNTIPTGGSIGYFTAVQVPYTFENAVYTMPVGGISKPVRTNFGYHIIKKTAERPARGQIKVAHILCAAKKSEGEAGLAAAKAKADSILAELQKGYSFDTLARYRNDDRYSVNNNGELAAFGTGAMVAEFENAAFALVKPGDLSKPVRTDYGYHIIKLIEKLPIKPFEDAKNDVTKKVERDVRVDMAKRAFLEKMKVKNGYTENTRSLDEFIKSIPDSLARAGTVMVSSAPGSTSRLFNLGSKTYTINDFKSYLETSARGRLYGNKEDAIRLAYNNYVEATVMDYEESQLEFTNEDYKNLLKEYRDGIILFDLTDKSVWSRASIDTTGLQSFYAKNSNKYQWLPGSDATVIKCTDLASAQSFLRAMQNGSTIDAALTKVNEVANSSASQESTRVEFDKVDASIAKLAVNQFSAPIKNSDNSYSIYRPNVIYTSATSKNFADARGYVIADYQDFLEKEWLATLAVLKSLVKAPAGKTVPRKK
jgi:peptidyl-prolyl cis-trans isomerase SurA